MCFPPSSEASQNDAENPLFSEYQKDIDFYANFGLTSSCPRS